VGKILLTHKILLHILPPRKRKFLSKIANVKEERCSMKRIVLFMVCIFLLPAIFAEASTKEKNVRLFQAAERGNLTDVQIALNGGADVNAKSITGWTALIAASYCGYTYGSYAEVVKLLLDKGADVNIKADEGITALKEASSGGCAEVVKLLLAKGADVNIKTDKGITALMEASSGGSAEVVKLLLDKGADVNVKNSKGKTALVIAKDKGKTEIVGMLERAGAKK
jgi:ankyrin repeat protein